MTNGSNQVEALTSVKTQLPYEYYVLPFCHKGVNLQQQDGLYRIPKPEPRSPKPENRNPKPETRNPELEI